MKRIDAVKHIIKNREIRWEGWRIELYTHPSGKRIGNTDNEYRNWKGLTMLRVILFGGLVTLWGCAPTISNTADKISNTATKIVNTATKIGNTETVVKLEKIIEFGNEELWVILRITNISKTKVNVYPGLGGHSDNPLSVEDEYGNVFSVKKVSRNEADTEVYNHRLNPGESVIDEVRVKPRWKGAKQIRVKIPSVITGKPVQFDIPATKVEKQ